MTKLTAMIVDDEPDIRDLLEITLSRMGLNTVTAGTLAEGIAGIQKHTPNVCLTDMNLPDGKGIELVQWIQQHSPNTPVAVITAYGSMDIAIESLKAGAFDFVSKPVELPQLRELINAALKLAKNSEPAPEDNNDRFAAEQFRPDSNLTQSGPQTGSQPGADFYSRRIRQR